MPSELTFRAQLINPEQKQLYDYWSRCAGERHLPRRADLDPAHIPNLLPSISLIDVGVGLESSWIRLAGTNLRDIYGYEITGKYLRDLDWGEKQNYWWTVYRKIIDTKIPRQGIIKGPSTCRDHVVLFWLRLPLSDDGEQVNKILCHDVAYPVNLAASIEAQQQPAAIGGVKA